MGSANDGNWIASSVAMECEFQVVKPDEVEIAGMPSRDMTICAAGRTLGRLGGFVIDRAQQRICYLIVRASGLFAKSTLLPFAEPRFDVDARAIELAIDEHEVWKFRNFTPEHLLAS